MGGTPGYLGCLLLLALLTGITRGNEIPSISDAMELLKIEESIKLSMMIAEKATEIEKKEEENKVLIEKIDQQKSEINLVTLHNQALADGERMLKGSRIIRKAMMKSLVHHELLRKERESTEAKQKFMLDNVQTYNENCRKEMDDNKKLMLISKDTIELQSKNMRKLKQILSYTEDWIATVNELEMIKASDDPCELPSLPSKSKTTSFVDAMSKVLGKQKREISALKAVMENDKTVKSQLKNIKGELSKHHVQIVQSNMEEEVVQSYDNLIKKQSAAIRDLGAIASYSSNVEATFRYEEDSLGNLMSASPCHCIPEIQEGVSLSLVLARQGDQLINLWTPWQYTACFEWENVSASMSCGTGGEKMRSRLTDLSSPVLAPKYQAEAELCGDCGQVEHLLGRQWTPWSHCGMSQRQSRTKLIPIQTGWRTQKETQACSPQHHQCTQEYTTLTDEWRKIHYTTSGTSDLHCEEDTGFSGGWTRFSFNNTSAWIPTKPPPKIYQRSGRTCGTHATSWADSTLPELGDPPQDIKIKFAWSDDDDFGQKRDAKVVACVEQEDLGEGQKIFYLYDLSIPTSCKYLYCATTKPVELMVT